LTHSIRLQPIGVLHNEFTDRIPDGWETALATIELEPRWAPALDGVEGFSHVIVLWWLDRMPRGRIELHTHPEGRQDLPLIGVLATRTPYRPNPIGLQVVELVSRNENTVAVRGIDALDGSPVLDIKPYLPRGDCVTEVRTPDWLKRLWEDM